MPVNVVGGGAVGSLVAALLTRGGACVTLVTRRHAGVIAQSGIGVVQDDTTWYTKPAVVGAAVVPTNGVTFVAMPLHALAAAGPTLAATTGYVVPLCNGVDAKDRVAALAPRATVVYGTIAVTCHTMGGGVVRWYGGRCKVVAALPKGAAAALRGNGLEVTATANGAKAVWQKAAWLAPLAALCAAKGVAAGEARRLPVFEAMVDEVVTAAGVEGVSGVTKAAALFTAGRLRKDMMPSAARDARAGLPSELPLLVEPLAGLCPQLAAMVASPPQADAVPALWQTCS